MFLKKKFVLFDSVGFENMYDFFQSVLGLKDKIIAPLLGTILGTIFVGVNSFVEEYIFDPAMGIWLLFLFTLADIVVGVSRAISEKGVDGHNKFEPSKISRGATRFVVQVGIVASIFHLTNVYEGMVYDWLASSILLTFSVSTLWSSVKNAGELGWIDPTLYGALERILSVDRLVKKILGKEKKEDEDNGNNS